MKTPPRVPIRKDCSMIHCDFNDGTPGVKLLLKISFIEKFERGTESIYDEVSSCVMKGQENIFYELHDPTNGLFIRLP